MELISLIVAGFALFIAVDARKIAREAKGQQTGENKGAQLISSGGASAVPQAPVVASKPTTHEPHTPVHHQVELGRSSDVAPSFDVFEWLKHEWLLKLGVFFVLIACGWFVSYAFMEGWIGPLGRIMFGCVLGALILIFGWWRIQTYKDQGAIFLVLGSTIILTTIYAARTLYDFFTPFSALALMFITSAFIACASALYRHRNLAVVSVLLAGAEPLLVHSPTADYIALFAYLMAVVLGALVVVFHTGYRELTLTSFLVVALYSTPHVISLTPSSDDRLLVFGFAFASIFFVANIIGMVRRGSIALAHDTMLAAGNAALLLLYIHAFVPDVWKSLIVAAWTLVFGFGSFMALWLTSRREPFFIYAGISVVYLAAATAFELEGAALTIAFAVEAAMITLVTLHLLKSRAMAERVSILFGVPIVFSVSSVVSNSWSRGIIHDDMFVLVIVGVTLLTVGAVFRSRGTEVVGPTGNVEEYPPWQLVVSSFYAIALVWLCSHALIASDDTAAMFSLVVYVLCGVATYFYGVFNDSKGLRMYGAFLLLMSVARLLLVDVWQMELPARILTFFVIGGIFLSTAFIKRQQKTTTRV